MPPTSIHDGRERALGQGPPSACRAVNELGTVIWITGIPAAGKTTLAHALARELRRQGSRVVLVDGDDLRAGLSRDLGFDEDGRQENARRAADFRARRPEAGAVALTSLVSPFRSHRAAARDAVSNPQACASSRCSWTPPWRSAAAATPRGSTRPAAAGRLSGLTGWDAPYERPVDPDVHLAADPSSPTVAESVRQVLAELQITRRRRPSRGLASSPGTWLRWSCGAAPARAADGGGGGATGLGASTGGSDRRVVGNLARRPRARAGAARPRSSRHRSPAPSSARRRRAATVVS